MYAVNAAWSGAQVFGAEHPTVRSKRQEAANHFIAAVRHPGKLEVMFLPSRTVVANQRIDLGNELRQGVFARMSNALPNCLCINGGITPGHIKQLIRLLTDPAANSTAAIAGPFSLSWVNAGSENPHDSGFTTRPPLAETLRCLSQQMRDMLQHCPDNQLPDTSELEGLAADIATASTLEPGVIMPLADLKSHDEYTFVHAINVGIMASALCDAVGLSVDRTREVTVGAILHDVGKVAIPLSIIGKSGKLTTSERAIVQSHPDAGARIIAARADLPPVVLTIAYEHHMNVDGGGYPHRPLDRNIALPSQIVHIADVFDALRTHRPYRDAFSIEQAKEIMSQEAGKCYDAELLDLFNKCVVARVGSPTHADNVNSEQRSAA